MIFSDDNKEERMNEMAEVIRAEDPEAAVKVKGE